MDTGLWIFFLLLFTVMFFSVKKRKLTLGGAVTAGVAGCCIYAGAGFTGIAMIGAFFMLGILTTSWKIITKEKIEAAEKDKGRRTAGQVIANGGVAAVAGLFAWVYPEQQKIFQLMMAAAISSATADTISSELGTVYGKRFYNILSFKNDKRGDDGVVSAEGTLFGFAGSTIIAVIFLAGYGWEIKSLLMIVLAGTIGNISDSVLGATLERHGYLKNDAVNFINTFVAAVSVIILLKLL